MNVTYASSHWFSAENSSPMSRIIPDATVESLPGSRADSVQPPVAYSELSQPSGSAADRQSLFVSPVGLDQIGSKT